MNSDVFPEPRGFKPERWLDASSVMTRSWFAFGAGSRACIARNLANVELILATERVLRSGVMKGARSVQQGDIVIYEWFNSKVKDEKIELLWS
jgi:hypothetical protein